MKKIIDVINRYNKFLITAHINPEGDSLGSQLALGRLLERKGKRVDIVNDHKVPPQYKFLPGAEKISSVLKRDFEAAIFLDSSEASRVGKVVDLIDFENKITVNIDHHISNTNFANVNWVEGNVSSCGEMIYRLFKELNEELDQEAALNLYTAIFVDTGSFRYSNTKPQTHIAVAEMLNYGIKPEEIYQRIYETNTTAEVKLLGLALSQICLTADGKVCWVKVSGEMLKRLKVKLEKTDQFINFARSIAGVEVAVLFTEFKKDEVKINFRSRGKFDVNKLAQFFGGGGHQAASGCRIKGSIAEVERVVIAKVRELLNLFN